MGVHIRGLGTGGTVVTRPPEPPPHHIERPHLSGLLDRAARRPLTVLSAPAGWGKSTLLAAWARRAGPDLPVAWVTASDEHVPCFWHHVAAATTAALAGSPCADLAEKSRTCPGPATLRLDDFLGSVEGPGPPVVLILDNLHELTDAGVWRELAELAARHPPRLRLVLGCRVDPHFAADPAGLRPRSALLDATRLRFSLDESTRLVAAHGIRLDAEAMLELHGLVQGWAAGLRLAALALLGHPDRQTGLTRIVAGDRALREYLVAEVLDRLRPDVRDALLCTSIVDELTPDLVGVLVGANGTGMLDLLARSGVFLPRERVPAPHRLHPLLATALLAELRGLRPEQLRPLHQRAATWYLGRGRVTDAVRHSLAAMEWDRAAELVETHWRQLVADARPRFTRTIVPSPRYVGGDARLALAFAIERLDAGDPQAAGTFLGLADTLDTDGRAAPVRTALRVAQAQLAGDSVAVLAAVPALRRDSVDQPGLRALAMNALGSVQLYRGYPDAAERILAESLALARRYGLAQAQSTALRDLAACYASQGHLAAATAAARDALATSGRHELGQLNGNVWALLVLADVCLQQHRVGTARYYLDRALDAGAIAEPALMVTRALVGARVRCAAGAVDPADGGLSQLRRRLMTAGLPPRLLDRMALTEAEVCLSRGDLESARRLLDGRDFAVPDAWPAALRAKLYLAEGKPAEAVAEGQPYVEPGTGPLIWVIEANLGQARGWSALGDQHGADLAVKRALELAEDEDIRWPFVNGGADVHRLLSATANGGPEFVARLVADLVARAALTDPDAGSSVLSEREKVVLRFLKSALSVQEIASTLFLSPNTVKTHLKSIYRKLGVTGRRDVVVPPD